MLEIIYTTRFKKDVVRMSKRGKNILKLKKLIDKLVNKQPLEKQHYDHPLIGNYAHHRECHIEPDWLLIYKLSTDNLRLERTGSHSDLF